jgi:uncharacterized repeat protein (TIGR02543 family)
LDQTHTITAPPSDAIYTASFKTQYSLTASTNPTGGGTAVPAGTTWYDSGKVVTVLAKPNTGYDFIGWSGDISGKVNPRTITMNGPKNVTANFIEKVTLLDPNGGQAIQSGSLYPVSWMAPSQAVKFKLFHSMDNGTTWIPIKNDFVTGSKYNWVVPTPTGNKKKCLVKLVGYDAFNKKIGSDTSDAPFTIEVINLTYPNLTETFVSGSKVMITWTTHATKKSIAKTILYYTRDAGVTWSLIKLFSGDPNPRSFEWTVPLVGKTKPKCKVKVVLKESNGNNLGNDAGDNYFTISPP